MGKETAWKILEIGMNKGLFTQHKLSDYVGPNRSDYYNARKVINGLDRAGILSGYESRFLEKL
jgi:hypothetical protein